MAFFESLLAKRASVTDDSHNFQLSSLPEGKMCFLFSDFFVGCMCGDSKMSTVKQASWT